MPLDGTELFENQALVKLGRVERLLATEDLWCKGRQRDRKGRHCLIGALAEADGRAELTPPVMRAIREISGRHYWRIASFNDDPSTTHQDILRVLQRARHLIISDIARAGEAISWQQKLQQAIAGLLPTAGGPGARFCGIRAAGAPVPVAIDRNPARATAQRRQAALETSDMRR